MGRPRALAADDFGGLAVGLLLLLLMLELKDKLVARSELQAGRIMQQALLPKEAPRVAGWDVWISTQPANEVGGDLIDFVTHEDGRVGLVLADVCGKGLPAALLMARLQATLLAFVPELLFLLGARPPSCTRCSQSWAWRTAFANFVTW